MKILKTTAYIVAGLFVLIILIGIFAPAPKKETIQYNVIETKDISYAGCKRATYKITLDDNADKDVVEEAMASVINKNKLDWDNITVWAYKDSEKDSAKNIGYTLGQKEYGTCE